ncbi:MAG: glycosyltransferase family 2 protein [Chromatiales bacterium]|jgi:glycosyltransferase involved in cell wall biosynthesis|nr:glycosyltransferase family 2 protein [Chromatiales bacterium]
MLATEVIFWLSVALLIYVYVGYPALMYLVARVFPRPVYTGEDFPLVTVLIAAHNEQDCIEATVRNKLTQDYPAEKLDVVVVSDGSIDATDQRVVELCKAYPSRVHLIRQEPRAGKTSALNLAMPTLKGEIVVFSDANSMYAQDAVRQLVRRFADPAIGYVTGKMVYATDGDNATGDGCSAYMRYENVLRDLESKVGSVVGVDGGIDVIRKHLYTPMRADQLPDFVQPLHVVTQGYRVVYEAGALLREPALSSGADEYRMRVRVSLRALWALWDMRHLFNIFRYGFFSIQLASHKLLRYAVFLFLIAAAVTNVVLVNEGVIYQLALAVQVAFYTLAWWGHGRSRRGIRSRIGYIPYYFMLLNLASAQAFGKFMLGKKQTVWKPRTG